jgi:hypothetical protein
LQQQHSFGWGYTWTKAQLHAAGLVERAKRRGAHRRKRPRKPCVGMMLHQDASRFAWLAGQPLFAGSTGPLGADVRHTAGSLAQGAKARRDQRHRRGQPVHRDVYVPAHNARFARPAELSRLKLTVLSRATIRSSCTHHSRSSIGSAIGTNALSGTDPLKAAPNGSGDTGRYSRSFGSSASVASPPCGE